MLPTPNTPPVPLARLARSLGAAFKWLRDNLLAGQTAKDLFLTRAEFFQETLKLHEKMETHHQELVALLARHSDSLNARLTEVEKLCSRLDERTQSSPPRQPLAPPTPHP